MSLEDIHPAITRKPSSGSNVFANLFSGRKKKPSKDDISAPLPTRSKDASMESLEGEIVDHSHIRHDQMMSLQTARKRAISAIPGMEPPTTRLAPPGPPVRRVSESDAVREQGTPLLTHRPRPPMLQLHTSPIQTTPPAQGPRRRSSTRLASPSLSSAPSSRRTSSRPTSPSSPGFTTFHGFTAATPRDSSQRYGYASMSSPRSPMTAPPESFRSSAAQFPQNPVPFSLTIRPETDDRSTSVSAPTIDSEIPQQGLFDPAQFEDGSDGESWMDKLAPLIALHTPPTTSATSAFPTNGASKPCTPVLGQHADTKDRVSIIFDVAPPMVRSDSGPPPTFKVIPATPIVPPDEETPGDGSAADDDKQAVEVKRKKSRNSLPPVPVNPVRPRMLALLLDTGSTDGEPSTSVEQGDEREGRLGAVSLLGSEVFKTGSDSAEDSSINSSPVLPPVRSPSVESLQRNTAPLRLAHSPRLVTAGISHPVHSSLSMSSSLQSSRALTLSTSSTIGSSLDSLDTMDLDDVESALGTMLASLSTRPSLADRLALDDPNLANVQAAPQRRKAQEMELSALGFGAPDTAEQGRAEPSPRNFFPPLDYAPSEINLYEPNTSNGVYGASSYTSDDEDGDINDSETDSMFSDIDDLGSVSIAVVQKQTQAVFASPRTLSIGDSGMERLRH